MANGTGRRPWPPGASTLLADLLTRFPALSRADGRGQLLALMTEHTGRGPGADPVDFAFDAPEGASPREHLRSVVALVKARAPGTGLEALRTSLRDLWPREAALPFLDITTIALAGDAPLDAAAALDLVRLLLAADALPPAARPTPAQLARHVPHGLGGTAQLDGGQSLPEVVLHLSDLHGPPDPAPLLRFLGGLAHDDALPLHAHAAGLRAWLEPFGAEARPAPAAADTRLIVQIRVEEAGVPGRPHAYTLTGAYYRQPADGGPLNEGTPLPRVVPASDANLGEVGAEQLTRWERLAGELRAGGGVRVEFLLPMSLLEHAADSWPVGATGTPLGQNHPVVVRSLDRYKDVWLDRTPWEKRWSHLCDETHGRASLGRIAWPYSGGALLGLGERLRKEQELACVGLSVSWDRLSAEGRAAVLDALYMEGLPVLLWSRGEDHAADLVTALTEHAPARLRDLPEAVHHCRRHGRNADPLDVRHHITLMWEDPHCVDPHQDALFTGVV